VGAEPGPGRARERCHKIREANERMQSYLEDERRRLVARRAAIDAELRNQAILASREYAFCLYPPSALRPLMNV
jgi:hypothetical protein